MKFVHAADIHLDSPLRGLERYDSAPVDEIRGATRRAVENLVELCLREPAQLLVIAGDLYDGDWRDYNTGLFFISQVARLTQEGVKVVWVRGNHDAASQITKRLPRPDGAYELPAQRPGTLEFPELSLAVHGQSYAKRDVDDNLALGYPKPRDAMFNLGILHTALEGREGHDRYAPCTVDELKSLGYDYWALGHVHQREIVSEDPWIVFPGNLQGRHARETGPKGATVVTVEDGVVVSVEPRELDVVRWVECKVDVSGAASAPDAVELARAALATDADRAGDRLLAARVRLQGACAADAGLRSDREQSRGEIRAAAIGLSSDVWIEKILFETQPSVDVDALLQRNDPIADLLRSLRRAALDSEALAEITASLASLAAKLPPEYRALADATDFRDPDAIADLLQDVERDLIPLLLGTLSSK